MEPRCLLGEVVANLERVFGERLVAAALFGSRARGDARPDSDVDVYAVVRGLAADPFDRARLVAGALPRQVELAVQIVARTPEELEHTVTALHLELAADAVILHDPDGYLAARLQLVRRRIEEAGLDRDPRLGWRWRRTPASCDWAIDWDGVRT